MSTKTDQAFNDQVFKVTTDNTTTFKTTPGYLAIFRITQDYPTINGPNSTVRTAIHGIPSQEKPKLSY
jgi:hypothetical protein